MLLNGGRLDGVQVLSRRAVNLMWRNYLPQVTTFCNWLLCVMFVGVVLVLVIVLVLG